jgi:L-lactate dehydrogenase complex protein LldG
LALLTANRPTVHEVVPVSRGGIVSSRDAILVAVRAAQPAGAPLPDMPRTRTAEARDLREKFWAVSRAAAAEVMAVSRGSLWSQLNARFADARIGMAAGTSPSAVPIAPDGLLRIDSGTALEDLADLDVLVCGGAFGVAENGAIWLPESRCGHRAAPFLARRLVVVLDASVIVPTMHEAYARAGVSDEGFGVFIAGPSKTADIEQALVIGAHGPLGLVVVG